MGHAHWLQKDSSPATARRWGSGATTVPADFSKDVGQCHHHSPCLLSQAAGVVSKLTNLFQHARWRMQQPGPSVPLPSRGFFFSLIYLFLAVLGLGCCASFSLVEASGSYSLIAVHGLLIAVASVVVEHRLQGTWACSCRSLLQSPGSVAVAHRLSCSAACGGIFSDEGSNPHPLHWQADSFPMSYQGSPGACLSS